MSKNFAKRIKVNCPKCSAVTHLKKLNNRVEGSDAMYQGKCESKKCNVNIVLGVQNILNGAD